MVIGHRTPEASEGERRLLLLAGPSHPLAPDPTLAIPTCPRGRRGQGTMLVHCAGQLTTPNLPPDADPLRCASQEPALQHIGPISNLRRHRAAQRRWHGRRRAVSAPPPPG